MTKRTKAFLEWFFIGLIALSTLVLAILLSYQQVYAGRIYRNVYFGSLDLSGLNQKEAEKLLESKIKSIGNKKFEISSGNKSIKVKLEDTGITFNTKEIIEKIYNTGRGHNFWSNLIGSSRTLLKKTIIEGRPVVNQESFNNFVEISIKQLNSNPVDASLAIKDGATQEVQSQAGQSVNTENLAEKIIKVVSENGNSLSLEATVQEPKIKSSDYIEAKRSAEELLNKKIIFSYQDKRFEPSKQEIGSWIVFTQNNGSYDASFDKSNIKTYLNKIARSFETQKVDRKVTDTGEVLREGRDGIYLDKDFVVNKLSEQNSQSLITLELATQTEKYKEIIVSMKAGVELGRFPGKYIDINLSTQTFCRAEGNTLIDCFLTSTGKSSMPTPTGTFSVNAKKPMGFSSIYGLYMPWWQEINGPIGIHELVVWPDGRHEDVSHLGQTVSHGCIRLGPGTAEMVYNWTDIGTPVYVHK